MRWTLTPPYRLIWRRTRASTPRWFLAYLVVFIFLLSTEAHADDCAELIKMHGLLGRAAVQCSFTFYSRGFVLQADACGEKVGPKAYKQGLSAGSAAFESKASQMGLPALCAKILKDFPYQVRQ